MSNDAIAKLRERSEQARQGAALISEEIMDWQIIQNYLCNRLNDLKLTNKQQEKLDRYQYIYNQTVGGKYTKQEIISQLMRMHDGLSMRQAYSDFNATQEIFSNVINLKKSFILQVEYESAVNLKRKAEASQDFKTAALFQKNILQIADMLPDEEDNANLFEGIELEAVFDPRLLGAPPVNMKSVLDAINAKRRVKIKTDMFTELDVITDDKKEETL